MAGRNKARRTLFKALADARLEYDGAQDSGRNGALLALIAINNYLTEIGASGKLQGPFFGLASALQDLENGKLNPMLIISEKPDHRPPQTIEEGQVKAWASFCLTLLMKAGEKKALAANKVARAVVKWDSSLATNITGNTVAAWRDRIKQGNNDSDPESRTYYELLHHIQGQDINCLATALKILNNGPRPEWKSATTSKNKSSEPPS